MKDIHPLINELNVSGRTKSYFNQLELYDILEDPMICTDEDGVDECIENRWSFGVELDYCNKEEIYEFFQSVIKSRQKFLQDNKIKIPMVFYTWYDEMSGNFYFSTIPENWSKLRKGKDLPFGCDINKVKTLNDIIDNFIHDEYKGVIPFDEFEIVDSSEDDEDDSEPEYTLDVWSTRL